MTWLLTYPTGAEVPVDVPVPHPWPQLSGYRLADAAHSISMLCRFVGHVRRHYTVAEHSLLVVEIMERELGLGNNPPALLAGLVHDLHEAFMGDIHPELKRVWIIQHYERQLQAAVLHSVGAEQHRAAVPYHLQTYAAQVKTADNIALATERRDLTAWQADRHLEWAVLGDGTDTPVRPVDWIDLTDGYHGMGQPQPGELCEAWLNKWHELCAGLDAMGDALASGGELGRAKS